MTLYVALTESRAFFFDEPPEWDPTEEDCKELEEELSENVLFIVEVTDATPEQVLVYDGDDGSEVARTFR